jgi:4-amino-4-deoxy-L-arabinose transferase-like glycosyltransferase
MAAHSTIRPALVQLPHAKTRTVDWFLVGILLLGFVLRWHAILETNWWLPDTAAQLRGDEPGYANTARELLNGRGFTWPGRVPLYPVFLAGLFWTTGESIFWTRMLQSLVSLLTIYLTYRLAADLGGRTAARIAAALVAVLYPLVHEPVLLMSEVLFTPMLLLITIQTQRAFRERRVEQFVLLGALVGIADLIRPTLLLYPLFLAGALLVIERPLQRALRNSVVIAGAVLLVLSPWLAFMYAKHRELGLQTSNAFLWQGSPEYFHLTHDQGYTYQRVWSEVLYGPHRYGPDPTTWEGEHYWTRRAVHSIRTEPFVYVRYAGEKLFTYWLGDPSADWGEHWILDYSGLRARKFGPRDAIDLYFARLIPPLALLAIAWLWRDRRRFAIVYLLLAYATLFHAATHAEARLSEPFYPLLAILIGSAIAQTLYTRAHGHHPAPADNS